MSKIKGEKKDTKYTTYFGITEAMLELSRDLPEKQRTEFIDLLKKLDQYLEKKL